MTPPTPIEPHDIVPPAPGTEPRHVNIYVPSRHNAILHQLLERINADEELCALWTVINVNAVDRLGMSDHGPVHVQIVANIAVKLLRLLESRQVVPNIVKDFNLMQADAEVVGVL